MCKIWFPPKKASTVFASTFAQKMGRPPCVYFSHSIHYCMQGHPSNPPYSSHASIYCAVYSAPFMGKTGVSVCLFGLCRMSKEGPRPSNAPSPSYEGVFIHRESERVYGLIRSTLPLMLSGRSLSSNKPGLWRSPPFNQGMEGG